jgi:serine/threonine protein kinase
MRENKNKKTRNRIKKRKNTRKRKGGEAIAAGGYGCVFKPALKCATQQNEKNEKNKNTEMVSKLLMRENAYDEMEEIEKVLTYLKKNPRNSNYFIINDQVSLCTPAPLTLNDLQNYDAMCASTKMMTQGITSANINQNLDKLNIITMLDGGKDLEEYWTRLALNPQIKTGDKIALFRNINKTLLDLLNNGIVPLNKDGLFHFDIKGANILVGKDGHTRVIDWGASFEFTFKKSNAKDGIKSNAIKSNGIKSNTIKIPPKVYNRAIFQYNVPLSVILFMEDLSTFLQKSAKKLLSLNQNEIAAELAKEIIMYSIKEAGIGHFQDIIEKMVIIYGTVLAGDEFTGEVLAGTEFTIDDAIRMIQNYISAILLKYLDFSTFTFDLFKFFTEVFIHNVDVYGFIISYMDLVIPRLATAKQTSNFIKKMYMKEGKEYIEFMRNLAFIFHDFCWSTQYAATRIPLSRLTARLRNL